MGISSDEARRIQFSGSEHAYEAAEVEDFRKRVVAALEAFEALKEETRERDPEALPAAQRARQQAVQLAEKMLRDVMGASSGEVEGLRTWQEAAMLQAVAQEEMSFVQEEARRLTAIALAERDAIRARYAQERRELRAELQHELQVSRAAAASEADDLTAAAQEEATQIVESALSRADHANRARATESRRLERRLATLHQAVADAEARFRRLTAMAANDLGTLQMILDDTAAELAASSAEDLATIDLTNARQPEGSEPADGHVVGLVEKSPDVGFYERRLAGLRDRLEKSGHPPE